MSSKRMDLQVIYDDEVILKLPARSLELVSQVKKRIGARTQLSPGEIILEYNGKTLNDNLKLDHCGVFEDSPEFRLTVKEQSYEEVVMEQTSYQSPYDPVVDSRNLLVQQTGASPGGQDNGVHSGTYYHEKNYGKVEVIPIDLRTHYPTPGASSDDAEETETIGNKVPERLTNSISLGLRLHSAHMLSMALAEFQFASQALLSNYEDHEAQRRVSMAEDRLKEEMRRMGATLQDETVNNQEIGTMTKQ